MHNPKKLPKALINKTISELRSMTKDKTIQVIADRDNDDYFQYRAAEALEVGDLELACKLLILLMTRNKYSC